MWFIRKPQSKGVLRWVLFGPRVKDLALEPARAVALIPKATYLGIKETKLRMASMTAKERAVRWWELASFGVLNLLGFVLMGFVPLIGLLFLVGVGVLWMGRRRWNPIRQWLERNLNQVEPVEGVEMTIDRKTVEEILEIHLEAVRKELNLWNNFRGVKKSDEVVLVLGELVKHMTACADACEAAAVGMRDEVEPTEEGSQA